MSKGEREKLLCGFSVSRLKQLMSQHIQVITIIGTWSGSRSKGGCSSYQLIHLGKCVTTKGICISSLCKPVRQCFNLISSLRKQLLLRSSTFHRRCRWFKIFRDDLDQSLLL